MKKPKKITVTRKDIEAIMLGRMRGLTIPEVGDYLGICGYCGERSKKGVLLIKHLSDCPYELYYKAMESIQKVLNSQSGS